MAPRAIPRAKSWPARVESGRRESILALEDTRYDLLSLEALLSNGDLSGAKQ